MEVVYARPDAFYGRLAILTVREHLCGYYQDLTSCVAAGDRVDPDTGHTVCCGCDKITVASGLRICDICDKEYIDKSKYQNPIYDTNCPRCVKEYDL